VNPFETLTQTVTAAITINHQIEQLKDELATLTNTVNKMGEHVTELRIRVAVLESAREADKKEIATEFERFALRMERQAIKNQLPPLPAPSETSEDS